MAEYRYGKLLDYIFNFDILFIWSYRIAWYKFQRSY